MAIAAGDNLEAGLRSIDFKVSIDRERRNTAMKKLKVSSSKIKTAHTQADITLI